jgi:transcriptional regulator with XRE-family HTH domain
MRGLSPFAETAYQPREVRMAKKSKGKQAEIVEAFAARLCEVRRSRGMTQAALALEAGSTGAYIWRLEAGTIGPKIDLVARLAKALGTTTADLLPEAAPPDITVALREQVKKLSDSLVESADRETLLMLAPLLGRLREADRKR